MFNPNTMMESLEFAKLEEDKIMAQQCSKSTFVSFKKWFPKDLQSHQLLEPLLKRICLKSRCKHIEKKGFVIIVMRNSLGDIDVLRKISISSMWILHPHLNFFMMLRIPQMMMVAFNNFLLQRNN